MFVVIERVDMMGVTIENKVVGLFESRRLAGAYLSKKGYGPIGCFSEENLFDENASWLWCGDWGLEKEGQMEEDYMASIEEVEPPTWIRPMDISADLR